MTTQSITVSTNPRYPTLIEASPQQPILVFNSDITNNVYMSEERSFIIPQSNVISLHPLAYVVLISNMYFATNGVANIVINAMPSISVGTSPVDVALSLIANGLATAANQNLANLVAQTIQNLTASSAPGNQALHSQVGNPFFTNPSNGNADTSGWTNRFNNGSFNPVGVNQGTALPVGSGQSNGFQFVSTGGGSPGQIQYGGGQNFSCAPGDIISAHWMVYAQQTTSSAFVGIAFFTAAGVFISTSSVNVNIITTNQWQKIGNEFIAPANAGICGPVFGVNAMTNGQGFYGTAAIAFNAGAPGTVSGDHAIAIANTGINGNLPTLLDTEVLNATSGAWGPFTTALPACGSYLIAVTPTNAAQTSCSDFTVSHLDAAGNIVHQDFFGAVPGGQWPANGILAAALALSSPTLLRGNIYGTTLQISGNKAAAAFCNFATGASGIVMTGFTYRLYTLPYNVPDTMPKMSNGGASLSANGFAPSNLLFSYSTQAIPAAGNGQGIAIPYAGPAKLFARQTAAGTVQLFGYSVANGSNRLWNAVFDMPASAAGVTEVFPVTIPACLVSVFNSNTAGGMNSWLSLVGDVST